MTEADLRIVNLQLELSANTAPIAVTEEQKTAIEAERAAKEKELQELLASRSQSVQGNLQDLEQKVDAELAPIRASGQKELDDYAANLQKELLARRDIMVKAKAESIMATNNLPNPVEWNTAWDSRMKAKQSEVEAFMTPFWKMYACAPWWWQRKKNLDLIVIDEVSNVNATDVTDAIIASYSVAQ